MSLFDPDRKPEIEPADAVAVVYDFLHRCRQWAERDIPRRIEKVTETRASEDAAKLHSWISYLQFTNHAIKEIESGRIDHWFTGEDMDNLDPPE